jgi:hypothetical protein
MENEELREKLLCVLRNKADEISFGTLVTEVGRIWLNGERKYRIEKYKIFGIFPAKGVVFDGYDYSVSLGDNSFSITEEEYEEIMQIRQEKIKQKQLEELEKLCNSN